MKVSVFALAIDVIPGDRVVYKKDDVFECPIERTLELGNSVIILEDTMPLDEGQPPKRKRR